jgi:hypothetical protein
MGHSISLSLKLGNCIYMNEISFSHVSETNKRRVKTEKSFNLRKALKMDRPT